MRADAERNRQRVLDAAARVFAAEGLSVPVHEIARRAGVGTGTVSRHFPTKESLYEAIVVDRVARLVDETRDRMASQTPGEALFSYLSAKVRAGAVNRGLAEVFAGAGVDMQAATLRNGYDLAAMERELLHRAQQAGAVRGDVQWDDVKALILACLSREREAPDPQARERMLTILRAGLAA